MKQSVRANTEEGTARPLIRVGSNWEGDEAVPSPIPARRLSFSACAGNRDSLDDLLIAGIRAILIAGGIAALIALVRDDSSR